MDLTLELVTVITANYNGIRYLREAVESVLAQDYGAIEYIIVDDGSTDDSKILIEELSHRDDRIKPIFLSRNVGVAEARNQGIKNATGKYITFIDADDIWCKEKISSQVNVFQKYPKAGLVVTAAQVIGAQGQYLCEKKPSTRRDGVKQGQVSLYDYVSGQIPASINTMTKRECINRVGLFNPRYVIGEDYELWMRIVRHYEYYYIDKPLHYYRIHDNNATKDKLFNRKSKLKILEEMLEKDPCLESQLGDKFQVILHRKYNALGRIYFEKGQLKNAKECFEKALNIKSHFIHTLKSQLWLFFIKVKS
ncbi:MAG: glycosyltransferase [Cellvibrionaceae bacterium]